MNFKFQGVWIHPNGDLIETNDIQSHRAVLNMEDVKSFIVSEANKKNIPLFDISVASMKVGFIRILNYGNQIAIELIGNPGSIQKRVIIEKIKQYSTELEYGFSENIDNVVVENPETNEIKMFNGCLEAIRYFESL